MLKGWALDMKSEAAAMIDVFLAGYGGPCDGLLKHLGLMLLARIDGKSTVPYITDPWLKEMIRSVGSADSCAAAPTRPPASAAPSLPEDSPTCWTEISFE